MHVPRFENDSLTLQSFYRIVRALNLLFYCFDFLVCCFLLQPHTACSWTHCDTHKHTREVHGRGAWLSGLQHFSNSLFFAFLFKGSLLQPVTRNDMKSFTRFYVTMCVFLQYLTLFFSTPDRMLKKAFIRWVWMLWTMTADCLNEHLLQCTLNLSFPSSVFLPGFDSSRPGHIWNYWHEEVTWWARVRDCFLFLPLCI